MEKIIFNFINYGRENSSVMGKLVKRRKTSSTFARPLYYIKGSVHTWNKVSQIYLGHGKKQLLLKHFGQMSRNY